MPLATLAANPFTDLTGGPHDGNIDAISNAGITKGCDPPAYVSYCPTANVTREEMASFLARTAGLGGNPPIANALMAQTATSAGNANTVGGLAPSGLVRAARESGSVTATGITAVIVLTLTLDAPGPGIALVTAGAGGVSVGGGGTCPCDGYLALRLTQPSTRAPYTAPLSIASNSGSAADHASLAYAFPVATGVNTFELLWARRGGTADILLTGQGTVLFVPFGGTGSPGAFGQGEP